MQHKAKSFEIVNDVLEKFKPKDVSPGDIFSFLKNKYDDNNIEMFTGQNNQIFIVINHQEGLDNWGEDALILNAETMECHSPIIEEIKKLKKINLSTQNDLEKLKTEKNDVDKKPESSTHSIFNKPKTKDMGWNIDDTTIDHDRVKTEAEIDELMESLAKNSKRLKK